MRPFRLAGGRDAARPAEHHAGKTQNGAEPARPIEPSQGRPPRLAIAESAGLLRQAHERRITIHGKGDKIAQIPLTNAMWSILAPLKPAATIGGPVFRNMSNDPLTYAALSAAFRKACVEAGVKNLRLHDLRHTAATRLLRLTGNIKLVQRLLRHSEIGTTAKYAHTADDELLDAMESVDAAADAGVTPKVTPAIAK